MHEYYAKNRARFRKDMRALLGPIANELSEKCGKDRETVLEEICAHYERNMLENFPYIGGDAVSGTKNLTGAYCFVSMGEVLKGYGVTLEEAGHLMVLAYERRFQSMPGFVRKILHVLYSNIGILNRMFRRKDAANARNAVLNPGSFETKTMIPPEEGYDFSYHNLVCPLANFARKYGYGEYMPYLCNLDYVMFGAFDVALRREHTCFEDGDFCDFKMKLGEKPLAYWPPVFTQGGGYK
ncbi:MAG: L-2-amino-thiazoline-4-carboxylic acid hydrolase [Clostridia bacterium]|nr:L-2-amino-thiazoline-4-carboxylic acid hydrolase [Clostridia bacterium]